MLDKPLKLLYTVSKCTTVVHLLLFYLQLSNNLKQTQLTFCARLVFEDYGFILGRSKIEAFPEPGYNRPIKPDGSKSGRRVGMQLTSR
jgi:hypothetical protein